MDPEPGHLWASGAQLQKRAATEQPEKLGQPLGESEEPLRLCGSGWGTGGLGERDHTSPVLRKWGMATQSQKGSKGEEQKKPSLEIAFGGFSPWQEGDLGKFCFFVCCRPGRYIVNDTSF